MLGGANSSLFESLLVRKEGLADTTTVHYQAVSLGDELFNISALPDLETAVSLETLKTLQTRILAIIDSLKTAPPSLEDLERARTQITARRVFEQDEPENRALQIGMLEMAGLSWRTEQARLDALNAITPQDIQRTAQTFLVADRLITSYALPEESAHE